MSDDGDDERLVAEIRSELKERAKADPRTIRDIVEASLEREFATTATAAVERRIEEKEENIERLDKEIRERERKRAAEKDDLERLQRQLNEHEEEQGETLADARESLEHVPHTTDNPAIKNWAGKLNLTPEELIDEL
jgi:chromosome segregation ATPase